MGLERVGVGVGFVVEDVVRGGGVVLGLGFRFRLRLGLGLSLGLGWSQ